MKGTSKATLPKQKRFEEIVKQHLIVVNMIQKKKPDWKINYSYIDGTSYKGIYPDDTGNLIKGSPIIFLEMIKRIKPLFKIKCFFIDKDKDILLSLRENIYKQQLENIAEITYICGEYEIEIPNLLKNDKNFGLIYIDPFGIFNDDELKKICSMENTITKDILINCNTTSIKRTKSVFGTDDLKTRQKKISKKYWYISPPHIENDPWGWCFLYGINTDRFKPSGFFPIDSEDGNRLLCKANYTKEEYKNNLPYKTTLEDFNIRGIKNV